MKKIILLALMSCVSVSVFSKEEIKNKKKKKKQTVTTQEAVIAKPCDSKEDILKKLEEKKKETAEPKAFSLQGGDTGCKVK